MAVGGAELMFFTNLAMTQVIAMTGMGFVTGTLLKDAGMAAAEAGLDLAVEGEINYKRLAVNMVGNVFVDLGMGLFVDEMWGGVAEVEGGSESGRETNIDGAINNGQPLNNHRIVPDTDASSLPATKQTPNSSADLLNPDGSVKQRRYYGADGKAQMDIDFNHTDDGTHEFPHIHIWDWSKKPPRQDSRN